MEILGSQVRQARQALKTLGQALGERPTAYIRDSSIKRFEYSFDLIWKLLRRYLQETEGLEVDSPKSVFREALKAGLLDESETEQALKMTDDRNLTAHTYDESLARQVCRRIRSHHPLLMRMADRVAGKSGQGRSA